MDASIVSVQGVSHKYERDWALKNISFTVDRKGIVGLLGSNGAGKSTCMNAICGVLHPTRGDITIGGESIRKHPQAAKGNIGFLPQQAPLYADFTVREYLTYCGVLRGIRKQRVDASVDRVMRRLGIHHHSNRLIRALSGGYRQRVGIAQSVIHDPQLVVMDEPTNGLDPNQILSVRTLIRELAEDHTILLSSHILPEVKALCDEVKMIEQGELIFEGTMGDFESVLAPDKVEIQVRQLPTVEDLRRCFSPREVDVREGNRFRLEVRGDSDETEQIARCCLEQGWGLVQISFERVELEEVFSTLSSTKRSDQSMQESR